ncbi:MAG TPA: hypothetical protein PKN64_01565 [Casimicrobium sp.]|nr:hypothetical protein [Casimicrobium sp.]
MRADMYKVIVERPRLIHGNWLGGGREVGFRQFMASEERPAKLGIRAGHHDRKRLNENLAPLKRFLMSQVGRPWDKVHAELLAGIDQRNAVQQHILAHVDNYVLTEVRTTPRPNGRGVVFEYLGRWWGRHGWRVVTDSWAPLFVDPRTGILRLTHAQEANAKSRVATQESAARRDAETRRVISKSTELRCADDVWYEVTLAEVPGGKLTREERRSLRAVNREGAAAEWDVWDKRSVTRYDADRYAVKKRQLSSAEIVAFGLRQA